MHIEEEVLGKSGRHFENQKKGVVLAQHMPTLSLTGSLASHHQRSFPAKTCLGTNAATHSWSVLASRDNSQALIIKPSAEVGAHNIIIYGHYQHTNAK